jgi:ABC-2 type transport system ATP-binding protein
MVINEGRILSDGSLADLRASVTKERWLIVDLENAGDTVADPDASVVRRDGRRVTLAFDPERVATPELIRRVTAGHAISDLFVENPPIEEIIARIYRETKP